VGPISKEKEGMGGKGEGEGKGLTEGGRKGVRGGVVEGVDIAWPDL